MPIQIYCYASCGNKTGLWAFCVEYFKEHGNTKPDIWESNDEEEMNTTLIQMQFASILKAFFYLNGLTYDLEPDTTKVVLHAPSKEIIKWLKKEYDMRDYPTKRDKVDRLYRAYCDEIWVEMRNWNVEYKVIDKALPDWLLQRRGWN